jgi:hypothetical protein
MDSGVFRIVFVFGATPEGSVTGVQLPLRSERGAGAARRHVGRRNGVEGEMNRPSSAARSSPCPSSGSATLAAGSSQSSSRHARKLDSGWQRAYASSCGVKWRLAPVLVALALTACGPKRIVIVARTRASLGGTLAEECRRACAPALRAGEKLARCGHVEVDRSLLERLTDLDERAVTCELE